MTQEELNQKLADLRIEWLTAGPGLKKLIEVRAKLLKKRFAEENAPKSSEVTVGEMSDEQIYETFKEV